MPQPERPPAPLAERYAAWRPATRTGAVPTQHAVRGDDEDGWAPVVRPLPPVAVRCPGPRRTSARTGRARHHRGRGHGRTAG
jgi:hypothetical protein